MAEQKKKSQAERAVLNKQQKSGKNTATSGKKPSKETAKKETAQGALPIRFISAAICLGLFILFLVMFLKPEGVFIEFILGAVLGIFGKVGFYVAVPALLYLFVIHAFSTNRPIILRSVCLVCFVVCCGCISQLNMTTDAYASGISVLGSLYAGGAANTSAGLLCGGLGMILQWLCGTVISYILLIIAAVLTLLASFQITIPSIIRAIQNRPRADWEEEDQKPLQPEPAAVVVNHIANKRIEYVEQKRQREAERQMEIDIPVDDEPLVTERPKVARKLSPKATEFMRDVDGDVEAPVAVSEQAVYEDSDVDLIMPKPEKPAEKIEEPVSENMPPLEMDDSVIDAPVAAESAPQKISNKDAQESAAQVAAEIAMAETVAKHEYCFPPIDLLENPGRGASDGTMEMRENTRRLNETLASFKIEAHIINVTRGPSVTRYEVELDKGVRLNKLTGCADDIALSLGASGVRIAAVPGKISVVGIEVPNRAVTTVSLREVIDSNEFNRAKSKSSFAVGKDIGGTCIVGNIAKLPHMLIAGTTGSGKSVCMNSIIISLLYKASPEDVKLIMVDPKMVELGIYNGIPHLLIPVVTDPKKAAGSLQWAVTEMMRRYKAMSDAGVRDLESYNGIVEAEGEGVKLPQIVVIIDELADLMLVAAKEVEESICRIAQMGRAAGIHLIIATQRPSADVITGLMKANIPSRIAFAVASAMESRIILDTQGAEKLVGKGDMLYAPIGAGKPLRVQGCFVSDGEVEAVTDYVKKNFNTNYDQQVMEEIEKKAVQTGSSKATASDPEGTADQQMDGDEMLPAAVEVILETGQASVSMLQRRLKLGYARAARIVDEMEQKGIVGPFQGSKPRAILVTKEQWDAMCSGESAQMNFDDLSEETDDTEEFE